MKPEIIRTHWAQFYMNTPDQPPAPVIPGAEPQTPTGYFSKEQVDELLNKKGEDERSKLYGRIEDLQKKFETANSTLSQWEQRQADEAAARAEQEATAAAEAQAAREAEMTAKELLDQRQQEWQASQQETLAQIEQLRQDNAGRERLLELERQQHDLELYRTQSLAVAAEPDPAKGHYGIAPNLIRIADARNAWGATREEIDDTISLLVNETRSIMEENQQADIAARSQVPTASPNGGNLGPMEHQANVRTYSLEDLQHVAPGSPEHQRLREQYGMARPRQNGLFQ